MLSFKSKYAVTLLIVIITLLACVIRIVHFLFLDSFFGYGSDTANSSLTNMLVLMPLPSLFAFTTFIINVRKELHDHILKIVLLSILTLPLFILFCVSI